MDRAIDFITSYITKCVECRFSKDLSCEFMLLEGKAPSVDNNPYLEDGIMDLSSEVRAFRIQKKRGNPCEDQLDFEKYLRKLEYLLERITVPFMTTDLLRQIGKINRIYSIILRSSDEISCALGDITMASMEKCLARIDYFYLEQGADILCAINSVTSNYDRMDALLSMYPEVIVKSYINNAVVLQMDHLTSGNHHMTEVISRAREESMEPEADSINEDTSEEDFSFNFVNASGVEEVDRIFKLMIEDNPSYPDEVFNADLKSFRRKCDALANSDEPLEKKEAWVVSVINVIAESYFHFTWDGPTIIGDRLIAFWAVIEAAFLRAPQQICIKHLASELSIDDLVSRVAPETIKRREEDEYVHETNPISITESELYTELGPTIGYNERRICKKCEIEDCRFRWGTKKMYVEELDDQDSEDEFEEDSSFIDSEHTPLERFHHYFSGRPAIDLVEHILISNDYQEVILNPWRADKELCDEDIIITSDYYKNFCADYWDEAKKDINQNFLKYSDNPIGLKKYIYSLLKPFSYLSRYLYARSNDSAINHKTSGFLHDYAYADNLKYQKYLVSKNELLRKIESGNFTSSCIPTKDLVDFGMFTIVSTRTLLLKSYLGGFTENDLLEFLFRGINQFAYYIEGQLLEIGHKKSLLDYQVECGVIIIDTVDPIEIASACGWNIEYAYSLYNSRNKPIIKTSVSPKPISIPSQVDVIAGTTPSTEPIKNDSTRYSISESTISNHRKRMLSDKMEELIGYASELIIGETWQGDDIKEYGIFLKALSMSAFYLGKDDNIRWKDLPIFPMSDGHCPTIQNLRDAMRRYKEPKDGGKLKMYLSILRYKE